MRILRLFSEIKIGKFALGRGGSGQRIEVGAYKLKFNKKKVIFDWIIGVVLSVIGWILLGYLIYDLINLFILPIWTDSFDALDALILNKIIKLIVILFAFAIILTRGQLILSRVKTFRMYSTILSADPTNSIERIAASTDIPKVKFVNTNLSNKNLFVQDCLVNMINHGYFPKGTYIDPLKNCLVFTSAAQVDTLPDSVSPEGYLAFTCKNCGASNKIAKGSEGECAYCGSHIHFDL